MANSLCCDERSLGCKDKRAQSLLQKATPRLSQKGVLRYCELKLSTNKMKQFNCHTRIWYLLNLLKRIKLISTKTTTADDVWVTWYYVTLTQDRYTPAEYARGPYRTVMRLLDKPHPRGLWLKLTRLCFLRELMILKKWAWSYHSGGPLWRLP